MPEKEGEREHDRRWREKLANRSQTAIMGAEGSMGCPCKKSVSLPWRDRETLGFSLESDDACGSLLPRDYQRQLEIRSKQMDCENTLSPSSLSRYYLRVSRPLFSFHHTESFRISRLLEDCYKPTWNSPPTRRFSPREGTIDRAIRPTDGRNPLIAK